MIEEELTGKVIKIFYKIYNELGCGFLESVYQNAFLIELASSAILAESEKRIVVYYLGKPVGIFEADIIIEEKIIVELKAKEALHNAHEAQLVNYLRATDIEVGLLFNFGKEPEFKRKFFSNGNKATRGCSVFQAFISAFIYKRSARIRLIRAIRVQKYADKDSTGIFTKLPHRRQQYAGRECDTSLYS